MACFTTMTGESCDQLATMDRSMNAVSRTPSWFVKIFNGHARVVIFLISPVFSVLFCFVLFCFEQETIYTIRVIAVFKFLPLYILKWWAWKTSKLGLTVYIVFRLSSSYNFVSTALGMFTNFCLVPMLLLAGSLVPIFHLLFPCNLCCYLQVFRYQLKLRARFYVRDTGHARLIDQLTKKASEVREIVGHFISWQMAGLLYLTELRILYSDKTCFFNQWERTLYPNVIIIWINPLYLCHIIVFILSESFFS